MRKNFKKLNCLDLSYQENTPQPSDIEESEVIESLRLGDDFYLQDWPRMKKLKFKDNSEFFEDVE